MHVLQIVIDTVLLAFLGESENQLAESLVRSLRIQFMDSYSQLKSATQSMQDLKFECGKIQSFFSKLKLTKQPTFTCVSIIMPCISNHVR